MISSATNSSGILGLVFSSATFFFISLRGTSLNGSFSVKTSYKITPKLYISPSGVGLFTTLPFCKRTSGAVYYDLF